MHQQSLGLQYLEVLLLLPRFECCCSQAPLVLHISLEGRQLSRPLSAQGRQAGLRAMQEDMQHPVMSRLWRDIQPTA